MKLQYLLPISRGRWWQIWSRFTRRGNTFNNIRLQNSKSECLVFFKERKKKRLLESIKNRGQGLPARSASCMQITARALGPWKRECDALNLASYSFSQLLSPPYQDISTKEEMRKLITGKTQPQQAPTPFLWPAGKVIRSISRVIWDSAYITNLSGNRSLKSLICAILGAGVR